MICFSLLNLLFGGIFNIFCTMIAGIWVITVVYPATMKTFSKRIRTSQGRDELMRRNAAAIEKNTGKTVKSKKVRNGFWNWSDDVVVNGQRLRDTEDYTDLGDY